MGQTFTPQLPGALDRVQDPSTSEPPADASNCSHSRQMLDSATASRNGTSACARRVAVPFSLTLRPDVGAYTAAL